ncbi:MAG: clan AA aspartic protease [Chloroflexota bacterium]|nr:clan AA aspartic protease [Chloroflexota bacterium]MDE2896005.1 clan AA aspartic protease [Chloroflexota bacterium]
MTIKLVSSNQEPTSRSPAMGATHVTVNVSNPGDHNREWSGLFLVDTGATDSLVPRCHLEEIGIEPDGQRVYVLADGSELRLDIAVARLEILGEIVGSTVMFGDDDAEPLLGVTALESLGIEVDPLNQRLRRLPAVRLKGIRQ